MSDYDIQIKLDPSQAAQGAAKVVEGVAKTEAQAKKAQAAYDALGETFKRVAKHQQQIAAEAAALKVAGDNLVGSWNGVAKAMRADMLTNTSKAFNGLTEAIRREQAILEQINGPAKRYEQDLQTLDGLLQRGAISTDQYANEVRKLNAAVESTSDKLDKIAANTKLANFKQAAAGAAAAMNVLNEKMHLSETATGRAIVEAGKLAAVGAQIGGPWGAAIGATISLVDDLGNAFGLKAAFITKGIDEIEAHQKHAGLAVVEATKVFEAQGAALTGLAQDMSLVNTSMRDLTSAFKGLGDSAASVPDWLVRGLGGDAWDPGKLKGKLDAINNGGAYIGGLGDLGGNAAGGRGVDAAILAGQLNQAAAGTKQWFDSTELNKLTGDLVALLEAEQLAADEAERLGLALELKPSDEWKELLSQMAGVQKDLEGMSRDGMAAQAKAAAEWQKKLNDEISNSIKALSVLSQQQQLVVDLTKNAATSFGDQLVDAANNAGQSWAKWGEQMLDSIEKAIARALILEAITGSMSGGAGIGGHYGGLLGLLGFATGGVISPSGSGTTDTQTVMFRKAPSETVRIHTPGQEAAYSRGGSGSPVTVQVVDQRSDRALAPSRADHQLFVELARQNSGFLRGLTR